MNVGPSYHGWRDKEFTSKSNEITVTPTSCRRRRKFVEFSDESPARERKLRKGPLAQNTSSLRIGIRSPPRPPPVFLWFECKKSNIYTARFSYVGSTLSLAIWPNTVRRCVNYARLQQPWRIVGKLANYSVTVYTSSGLGNLAGVFTIFMPLANRIFSRRVKSRASAGCRVADRLRSR